MIYQLIAVSDCTSKPASQYNQLKLFK
jgi:hypothetical protein